MRHSSVRFLLLIFLVSLSRLSFAEETSYTTEDDCPGLAEQTAVVEKKFTYRCESAVTRKNSMDNQAAYAGQVEGGEAPEITVGAKSLGKVAGLHGGTSVAALMSCRAAIERSKAEMAILKKKIMKAIAEVRERKDPVEIQACTAAMDKMIASIDKLTTTFVKNEASLNQGLTGAQKTMIKAEAVAQVASGGGDTSAGGLSDAMAVDKASGLDASNTRGSDHIQTAMVGMQAISMAGNLAKGFADKKNGSNQETAGSLAPAALPAVGHQSTVKSPIVQSPTETTTATTEQSCTTVATGLGTEECQAILAARNPALIKVANAEYKPTIGTASVGNSEGSVVAKAYGASLLKTNSTTLNGLCKSNELVGCQNL